MAAAGWCRLLLSLLLLLLLLLQLVVVEVCQSLCVCEGVVGTNLFGQEPAGTAREWQAGVGEAGGWVRMVRGATGRG